MVKMYRGYLRGHEVQFVVAVLCVACEAFCDLLGPTLMSRVINSGIEQGSLDGVLHWGSRMLLATLCGACFAVTRNILASRVSQSVGRKLRRDLFAKIMNLSERDADKAESGSLITRVTNDTAQVTQAVAGVMRIFLKAPITCVGSIILATLLNPRLSVIIYLVVFAVGFLIVLSMRLSYPRYAALQKATDRMNAVVQEYLTGIRLVKAFGTFEEEGRRFGKANSSLYDRGVASQMVITLCSPFMSLLVGFGSAAALYVGSSFFERGLANPGDLSAFIIYMAQILTSLLMITNIFNVFVRTGASSSRIAEVFACEDDFPAGNKGERLPGSLSFEDVSFSYPVESGSEGKAPLPALRRLSFTVEAGKSLAVIGPTGSGKSTLCWLALRFYDPDDGRILLGGRNIKDLDTAVLRDNIAIVPQKATLFSGSAADNIRWGGENASDAEVAQAAARAQADFLGDKSEDYTIESGGVNISGGQKQRLSIARGFLKNAPVLLLDDATSALDAVAEAKVRAALAHPTGQTIITVTQRCTTAMSADAILVMDNGSAVGYGTHAELLCGCEMYREIYRSQIGEPDDVST